MTPKTFDEHAATWDDEEHLRRASRIAALLREALPLTPDTRLLDYGAGTDLLSQHLVDDVGHLVFADPSEGMRTVAFAALLPVCGTLAIVDLEEEDGSFHDEDFDGHHGFNRTELTASLTEAGFDPPRFEHAFRVPKEDRTYDLFLAVAHQSPNTGARACDGPGSV